MSPASITISVVAAIIVLKLWISDYVAFRKGVPVDNPLPGATPAPLILVTIGAVVSVAIVGVETLGEYMLGISGEQSTISYLYLAAMLGAGIVEELLFRGFFVVKNRGKAALIGSIVAFSVVFALIHGHLLISPEDSHSGKYELSFAAGPLWWTFILFINSLWWYALRFMPANAQRSLLPCFAGHIASNLAVFFIKYAQGFVA
ncbi:MAG: CPBP family intramembrane metalloprotease [Opitutales bacterium]|nr:CPBP family intramembrane metalloprotease [Opitutales bacterium]